MGFALSGFNKKNHYDRTTPCDHDTLRKALKDVRAQQWLDWFNGPVQQVFQSYGYFDPEGIFIGDGSYLFVPDNPAYEGSVVMWFDEHNHPVHYEELTPEERQRAHRERCYKWVSLLHLRRGAYVYAAAALLPGNAHEVQPLYGLVEQFVQTVGPGVIKWLVLDRGFIDGEQISRCKGDWGIDVLIPMKKKMDIWTDAWALAQRETWTKVPPEPTATPTVAPRRPEWLALREAKRQQSLSQHKTPPAPQDRFTHTQYCWIQGFRSWSAATVPLSVLCLQDHYADGHHQDWALITTYSGAEPLKMLHLYAKRTAIEERHRQLKCFYDLTDFRSRTFNAIAAQVVMVLLTYTLRQWQLWKFIDENLANLTPQGLADRLRLLQQWIVIYLGLSYTQLPVVTFTKEAILLEGEPRRKALRKLQSLEQGLLSEIPNPRPM
jgi:Transposase DDE domain